MYLCVRLCAQLSKNFLHTYLQTVFTCADKMCSQNCLKNASVIMQCPLLGEFKLVRCSLYCCVNFFCLSVLRLTFCLSMSI